MVGGTLRGRRVRPPYWAVLRLVSIAADSWDSLEGQLALTGVDIHAWSLRTLLAAVEVRLEQGAEDEKAWRRTRQQLYAPPPEVLRAERAGQRPRQTGMDAAAARALVAQATAEDAGFARR